MSATHSNAARSTAVAALRAAFPHTIPIFAGFWFLGMAYGIYMHAGRSSSLAARSSSWR